MRVTVGENQLYDFFWQSHLIKMETIWMAAVAAFCAVIVWRKARKRRKPKQTIRELCPMEIIHEDDEDLCVISPEFKGIQSKHFKKI